MITPNTIAAIHRRKASPALMREFQTMWDRTRVIEPRLTRTVTDEPAGKPALPVAGDITKPFEKVARTMRHTYRPFTIGADGRI